MSAASRLSRAAGQGNPHAQYDLGGLYSRGEGVPLDNVRAYGWLSLAAQGDDEEVARMALEGRREIESGLNAKQVAQALGFAAEVGR